MRHKLTVGHIDDTFIKQKKLKYYILLKIILTLLIFIEENSIEINYVIIIHPCVIG